MTRRISVPTCTQIWGIRCTEISYSATITHPMIQFCSQIGRFKPSCCRCRFAVRRLGVRGTSGMEMTTANLRQSARSLVMFRRGGEADRSDGAKELIELPLRSPWLWLEYNWRLCNSGNPTPLSFWKVMSQDCWAFFDGFWKLPE